MVFLFFSCGKDPVDTPVKTPVAAKQKAEIFRSFFYSSDNTYDSIRYRSGDGAVVVSSVKEEGQARFVFTVPFPAGRDFVSFRMDATALAAGNSYAFTAGGAGQPVAVEYHYAMDTGTGNLFFPGSASGVLTISRYDRNSGTIAGDLQLAIHTAYDPTRRPGAEPRQTVITVSCQFEDVSVPK